VADDVRLLRENAFPAVGKVAALVALSADQGTLTWKPLQSDISQSADLGYTYGTFEFKRGDNKVEHGSYVRVWKKQNGKWKVVFDVLSPDPPPDFERNPPAALASPDEILRAFSVI
jgi:ketosteroid isomerase-like protein